MLRIHQTSSVCDALVDVRTLYCSGHSAEKFTNQNVKKCAKCVCFGCPLHFSAVIKTGRTETQEETVPMSPFTPAAELAWRLSSAASCFCLLRRGTRPAARSFEERFFRAKWITHSLEPRPLGRLFNSAHPSDGRTRQHLYLECNLSSGYCLFSHV